MLHKRFTSTRKRYITLKWSRSIRDPKKSSANWRIYECQWQILITSLPSNPPSKAQECRQERKGSIATNQILLRAEKKHHIEGWSRQVEVKQWKMIAQTITEKCEAQRFVPSIVEPGFGFTIHGSCATSTSFEVVLHGCDSGCFLWRTICLLETFALPTWRFMVPQSFGSEKTPNYSTVNSTTPSPVKIRLKTPRIHSWI